ncbi:hypothetical protein ACFL4P_00570 [Gemmatimonadota bacterium]
MGLDAVGKMPEDIFCLQSGSLSGVVLALFGKELTFIVTNEPENRRPISESTVTGY